MVVEEPKRGTVPCWGSIIVDLEGEQIDDFLRLRRQIVTAAIRIDSRHQSVASGMPSREDLKLALRESLHYDFPFHFAPLQCL